MPQSVLKWTRDHSLGSASPFLLRKPLAAYVPASVISSAEHSSPCSAWSPPGHGSLHTLSHSALQWGMFPEDCSSSSLPSKSRKHRAKLFVLMLHHFKQTATTQGEDKEDAVDLGPRRIMYREELIGNSVASMQAGGRILLCWWWVEHSRANFAHFLGWDI